MGWGHTLSPQSVISIAIPLENILEFLNQCLVAVGHPDVGDVAPCDVIPRRSLLAVVDSQPMLLHLWTQQPPLYTIAIVL